MSTIKQLMLTKNVAAATPDPASVIIGDGQDILITAFIGSAPFTPKACVRLIWDLGGGGEQTLWVIQNEMKMPEKIFFNRTGNGTKKLGLYLDNLDTATHFMSGFIEYEEI